MQAHFVRWSFAALGRVPRRAHLRVILFFWPTAAPASCSFSTPMICSSPNLLRLISGPSMRAGF
jgi:hypothetical protein